LSLLKNQLDGQWKIPDNKQNRDLDPNQDWWLFIKADSDERISESDETNNAIYQPIELVNEIIKGTKGDDKILGTEGKDVIRGFSGRDAIDAGTGNDLIIDS
jgi:Ca2+-binding RTX toxin-like protein